MGRQRQAGGQAGWCRDSRARSFKVTSLRAVLGASDAANGEPGRAVRPCNGWIFCILEIAAETSGGSHVTKEVSMGGEPGEGRAGGCRAGGGQGWDGAGAAEHC